MNKKILTILGIVILLITTSVNIKYSLDDHRLDIFNKTSLSTLALADGEGGGVAGCYVLCCEGAMLWPPCTYKCDIMCNPNLLCWTTGGNSMYCDYTFFSCDEYCPPENCNFGPCSV